MFSIGRLRSPTMIAQCWMLWPHAGQSIDPGAVGERQPGFGGTERLMPIQADFRIRRLGSKARSTVLLALGICIAHSGLQAQKRSSTVPNAGGYRIAGTVLNSATGEPVQRALVSALGEDDNHSIASVVSDADGHFAF